MSPQHQRFLAPACLLFTLAAIAPASAQEQSPKPAAKTKQTAQVLGMQDKLEILRERLEIAIRKVRSLVTPAELEQRLRSRKPQYRIIQLKGSPDAATPVAEESQPAAPVEMSPKRARLLGDEERAKLAQDALMTVDGLPIFEKEVKDLADYFASYRQGDSKAHRQAAIQELIMIRTAEAHFADSIADAKKRAQLAHEKAMAPGADFAQIAKQFSEGPSGPNGGSLGQFDRDQMVPSFGRHAFTIGVGRISPVFASPFGYHFLKVQKRLKGQTPAQDRVEAAHVLIVFTRNQNVQGQLMQRANSGASDIAVRKAEDRELLPAVYR
ncbi:MAG: hypothetical protein CSA62_14720 [Planctomycetota bacterium]|nr:MAG: hypothetical protein CSA62_14720 [Planctomycetota bacterium]